MNFLSVTQIQRKLRLDGVGLGSIKKEIIRSCVEPKYRVSDFGYIRDARYPSSCITIIREKLIKIGYKPKNKKRTNT